MKNRIAVAVASLLLASLGTAAYAQGAQQTTPPPATTSANAMSNGNMANDQSGDQMEQKIKHALTAHGVTATHVNVSFSDGTATLSGTVYTERDISKAKKAAMHVKGVKHVDTSGLQARKGQPASSQS
ncbi:MAG TPA: BON domain-containing protein [Rhodanobacteraceae bacterium]|nr:BON domain-containing protein [Rhodanobacteraceae bacterium]